MKGERAEMLRLKSICPYRYEFLLEVLVRAYAIDAAEEVMSIELLRELEILPTDLG